MVLGAIARSMVQGAVPKTAARQYSFCPTTLYLQRMSMVFYDYQGTAIAYCDDGEHLYTFAGRPVAYLKDGSVHAFSGAHLGRVENGLVRDNYGAVVFFTDVVTGTGLYIVRPIRKVKPLKGAQQFLPAKGLAAAQPLKPSDAVSWSQASGERFFE